MIRHASLLLVAAAPLGHVLGAGPIAVFAAGIAGVAALAILIKDATEQLAAHTGPAVGGLLSVSLGSLAELVLAIFVLLAGQTAVVHAQLTGSIIGMSLLGLGLAVTTGGLVRERQTFKRERAGLLSSLLVLSTVALVTPAVVDAIRRLVVHAPDVAVTDEQLSLVVSGVVLALYAANLIFTLVTHRDVFSTGEHDAGAATWPLWACLVVLAAATAAAAGESELISGELERVTSTLGVPPAFMGVVVLALVGNIAELATAISSARRDRLGLVMTICVGSSIQVALVLAPLLVIISWFLGHPMNLVFAPLDLFAITATALIVNAIAGDGETTWFEGVMLLGVYLVLAASFLLA